MRALSIVLVVLFHCPRWPFPWFQTFQENGDHGVNIFFVISGFLITYLFAREQSENGQISLGRFYARRALRLFPLYYLILAIDCLMIFVFNQYSPQSQQLFIQKLPSYLLYFSNWLPTSGQGPFFFSWSLAAEEQFYLTFGLLWLILSRANLVVGAFLLLATKFFVYQFLGSVEGGSTPLRILFSYQEGILLGVLTALAAWNPAIYRRLAPIVSLPWFSALVATGMALLLVFRPLNKQSAWDTQVFLILSATLILSITVRARNPVIDAKALTYVGRLSYAMYLVHMLVIWTTFRFFRDLGPLVVSGVALASSIGAASILHHTFELPLMRRYKSRFAAPSRAPKRLPPPQERGLANPAVAG